MKSLCLLVSAVFLLELASGASEQPTWKSWSFCKKPDPNKDNECIRKAIQAMSKDIEFGNAYFGTPRLNPLHLDELSLFQAGQDSKAVAVNITFKNCDISGLNTWQLQNARANWDSGDLTGRIMFSETVVFDADYSVNGKIILLPVRGQGKTKITFENMECFMHIKGHLEKKKGKEYFAIDDFNVKLNPKGATFHFGNILNGQTALSESINKVLNENWKDVMEEVKQPVSEGIGAAFKQISTRIFNKIPYDVLVPN